VTGGMSELRGEFVGLCEICGAPIFKDKWANHDYAYESCDDCWFRVLSVDAKKREAKRVID